MLAVENHVFDEIFLNDYTSSYLSQVVTGCISLERLIHNISNVIRKCLTIAFECHSTVNVREVFNRGAKLSYVVQAESFF